MKIPVRRLLGQGRLDEIAERAGRSRRVLGTLVSMTFDADPQTAWRAVDAMGRAAARIAEEDPAFVREHLRRLFWLMSEESGGICWRAPEAMAEIVGRCPELFADYVPVVLHLILEAAEEDLEHFRPGMLWAIGRLGPLAEASADEVLPTVIHALDHEDARVRGMAVWCLHRLGRNDALTGRADLADDAGAFDFYADGVVRRTRVGEMVRRVLGQTPDDGM